mgnify:FL=1
MESSRPSGSFFRSCGFQISLGINHGFVPLIIILSPVSLMFGSQGYQFSLDCRVLVTRLQLEKEKTVLEKNCITFMPDDPSVYDKAAKKLPVLRLVQAQKYNSSVDTCCVSDEDRKR